MQQRSLAPHAVCQAPFCLQPNRQEPNWWVFVKTLRVWGTKGDACREPWTWVSSKVSVCSGWGEPSRPTRGPLWDEAGAGARRRPRFLLKPMKSTNGRVFRGPNRVPVFTFFLTFIYF